MKISILIYFFGEGVGGGRVQFFVFESNLVSSFCDLLYTSCSPIHLHVSQNCIFMYYSRSFKCLVKSTFSVWLSSANNQKLGRIFGQRHYTKKILFVRINVDISSVLTNAGRRFVLCINRTPLMFQITHNMSFITLIELHVAALNHVIFFQLVVFTIHVQTAHFKIHIAYMQCQIALSSKPIVL